MNLARLVTALAVTATLTLAGCSDDPDPKLAPSTNQSASGSVEPSEDTTQRFWEVPRAACCNVRLGRRLHRTDSYRQP